MAKKKKTLEELLEEAVVPEDEVPYKVPDNWLWSRLGNIAKWGSGGTPKSSISQYYDGDMPWLVIGDLNDEYIYKSNKRITELGLKNSSAKLVNIDSVLVAMYGSIGKLGINKIKCTTNQAIAFTQEIYDLTYNKFLFYYLLSIRSKLISLGKGGTQQNISQTVIKAVEFTIPPLSEQKRIVKKIESLFLKLDKSKHLIEEARDDFENRKSSILAKAFRGELTKKWRQENTDVESAEELLKKIEESSSKKKKTNVIENIEPPYELPEKWKWVKLGEIGILERGKSKHRPRNDERLFGGPYPFIQTGDVAQSKDKILYHKQTLSEFGLQQSKLFPKGTVCITIAANIGDTAILTYDCCFPDSVVGFTPFKDISISEYANYYFSVIKSDLENYAPATAQKNINLAILREVLVPLPPFEEQKKMLKILDKLLEEESKIEELTQLEEQIELIKKSILAKAFRGELGTNDPSEESALELLKDILKEKL
ncbi:restriction endonuclease subunit S [Tepidibacter sp. Z1-5]|uniref:restriction endonuclease subunit S n=1 Tax=Tepidibacter sp. Z1-5 TaxID=3134138 RepID=UPI0030BDAAE8